MASKLIGHLYDLPKQMVADVLFDQSGYVKEAIKTVFHEGRIGLVLTSIMILLFLGNRYAYVGGARSCDSALRARALIILSLMGATAELG